jgi:peptide/nickel transport system permease protein
MSRPTGHDRPIVRPTIIPALRQDLGAVIGAALWGLFLLAALTAPWIAPRDPSRVDVSRRFASSSLTHPLGTDNLGRDVLSRLLYGSRLSLGMALAATIGSSVIGLSLGVLAGFRGGRVDTLIMRTVDVLQALPGLLLALAVVGVLGQGLGNLLVAMILVWWAGYARVVRGMTLSLRARPFIEAAHANGVPEPRLLLRHLLPNLIGPAIVLSTLDMGRTLLSVSGFSFLGLGVRPPTPEWGAMLAEAKGYLDRAPLLLVYPGVAITLMVLASNLLGDGLRDTLDPRLRRVTLGRDGTALPGPASSVSRLVSPAG